MVKFGERLPTLMVAAWKDKYIEYERLKAMLEDGALDAAASSAFYKELAAEIGWQPNHSDDTFFKGQVSWQMHRYIASSVRASY